ncbi:hypothetical protein PPYR_07985 [Photinus pyralis]|uniref:DUF4485 domain-containing protein n=1 Tax=Photinus pyralis TaxID=7054 RepID=A0A1Y1MUG0_PHOPY|nr:uncharacterized protein LOC116169332 [Photinus pyralis]KAB0800105.1 hypothetical protein PPYR_07985 [Photinus pyralis]
MDTEKSIENKLDQDFLFYLGFINEYLKNFKDEAELAHCNIWLKKLCGSPITADKKRGRNIYLSNLILCMQDGKLAGPFLGNPNEVDISDAMQAFEHLSSNLAEPGWLKEVADAPDLDDPRDGRTYLATRTLPGGEGAFAYLAVTLAEAEPKWLGGGEGVFDRVMEEKFPEYVPPMSEMERILLRRKDPVEREKVLSYYEALLQNINSELNEEVPPQQNDTINVLIDQLIEDLKRKQKYDTYAAMDDKQRRTELLLLLHDRVFARRQKTAQREEVLDEIEQRTMPLSFFDVSLQPEDVVELPATMWEQAINKYPNRKLMESLFSNYPHNLINKFIDLLANEKETIAIRMQKKHENISSQMRKELRKEGEKGRLKAEEAERFAQQVSLVLAKVKEAYQRRMDALQNLKDKKESNLTEQQRLYEQLRAALYDTQRSVEEEAKRGRELTDQINFVNNQTEQMYQVNEEALRKAETDNIALMQNIKKLRNAVQNYEARMHQIQSLAQRKPTTSSAGYYYY